MFYDFLWQLNKFEKIFDSTYQTGDTKISSEATWAYLKF